ncbi:Tad domain-containing protein [Telmatobacter sp. DSM 110680]|uniref:Tad domain-containing protein n=1 Tax=Telmatobacter sp. DSM 110680 TaxID=3036704 RepID=A0AAU7DJU0_9BACT
MGLDERGKTKDCRTLANNGVTGTEGFLNGHLKSLKLQSGLAFRALAGKLNANGRGVESGQALVFTAFLMAALFGFMGLAIDVGLLFRAKRNLQSAADAAATAGALDYYYYGSASSAKTMGCAAATSNGISGTCNTASTCTGLSGTNICINTPPQLGPNTSTTFTEAIVTQPNPTAFMSLFGFSSVKISARAVAASRGISTDCVYLMDSSMSDALFMKGNGTIHAVNCGVYVNSKSSTAVEGNGNTAVDAASLNIVGPDSGASSLDPNKTHTGVSPITPPIPLNLPGIPSTGCTSSISQSEVTVSTTSGSTKIKEASVNGSSSNNVVCFTNAGGVTIDDGVALAGVQGDGVLYVFEHGVTLNGAVSFGSYNGTPPTNGPFDPSKTISAVLDVAGGSLSQGNAALTIYAPTSGTYNSIALMQPSTNTTGGVHCPASPVDPCLLIQRGSSGSVFDGIVYAPAAYVELQDNAGAVYATGLIADGLFVKASDLYINNYSPANPTTTPFTVITLVE